MRCQSIFSRKNIINLSPAEFAKRVVKDIYFKALALCSLNCQLTSSDTCQTGDQGCKTATQSVIRYNVVIFSYFSQKIKA